MPREQVELRRAIVRLRHGALDLEMVAQARQFEAIVAPFGSLASQVCESQIDPTMGEQQDGARHAIRPKGEPVGGERRARVLTQDLSPSASAGGGVLDDGFGVVSIAPFAGSDFEPVLDDDSGEGVTPDLGVSSGIGAGGVSSEAGGDGTGGGGGLGTGGGGSGTAGGVDVTRSDGGSTICGAPCPGGGGGGSFDGANGSSGSSSSMYISSISVSSTFLRIRR